MTEWFRKNRRFMYWREDPTPYHVWVSEIMLQQTRVDTVTAYYLRFIEKLPDIRALSECPADELYKLWEGLGYYSRVRNMKKAAVICMEQYGGSLPDSFEELKKLPGIGSYTAGAVSAIAYHLREPVVDGNVLRVITRLSGLTDDITLPETKKKIETELRAFLRESSSDPSEFDQGLMELGALVCIPNGAPLCEKCPWQDRCQAFMSGRASEIPYKSAKMTRKTERKTVFVLKRDNYRGIVKRDGKGLLSGLYGLPEVNGSMDPQEALQYLKENGFSVRSVRALAPGKHVFTHVEWEMTAYEAELSGLPDIKEPFYFAGEPLLLVTQAEAEEKYALPTAFKKWDLWA